jgi:hypothetical protein
MAVGRRLRERRAALALLAIVAAAGGVLVLAPGTSHAQVAPSIAITQPKPPTGPIGTKVSVTPLNMPTIPATRPLYCSINYQWAGQAWISNASGAPGTVSTNKVPATAKLGSNTILAICFNPNTGAVLNRTTATFTVTPPTTTSTTTTTTIKTTTTTTRRGVTTTTTKKKGGPTTTGLPGSSTSSTAPGGSTTTTTAKPGTHHKKKITVLPSPGDTSGSTSTSYLKLDALAISPGAAVSAAGRGCTSDSPVTLTIGSTQVGTTTADQDGSFHAPLHVGNLSVGRYDVQAACGAVLTASFDVVLASRVDPGTSTTMVIIVFFILIGVIAFRRRLFPSRYPAQVRSSGVSDDEGL